MQIICICYGIRYDIIADMGTGYVYVERMELTCQLV